MKNNTELGRINVSVDAVASLTGSIVSECYGVVGMASKRLFKDNLAILLKKENYAKGVVVKDTKNGLILDIYVIVCYGTKVSQVVRGVQKKVKYELEKTLEVDFAAINVYVQGIKVVD
ncbi:MAG: Asp23/Gls24 family envelope stress response protein [Erysipelotrichaceae bacterium]|nr:Asp23/Gls24 family envelope stress response protein [Erysipelotrichaceae bacterium]MBQ4252680.1 Asp23/Gls24 family envelope stress response protein [Erysipelotrichaceae bacterium]MBQ7223501.1 Asp23/Gls24 family envelope stress response protein [Erysipelotrichaceae bacterium]